MRVRRLWPAGIIVFALFAGAACEDDPTDLDYLNKSAGAGGSSAAGTASVVAGTSATAGASTETAGAAGQ